LEKGLRGTWNLLGRTGTEGKKASGGGKRKSESDCRGNDLLASMLSGCGIKKRARIRGAKIADRKGWEMNGYKRGQAV